MNYPEIHPPIITFADIDPKYERYAYEKAEEAFSNYFFYTKLAINRYFINYVAIYKNL